MIAILGTIARNREWVIGYVTDLEFPEFNMRTVFGGLLIF
jgi:hypothetical protein